MKGTKISVPWEWGISSTPNLSIASPLSGHVAIGICSTSSVVSSSDQGRIYAESAGVA